MRKYRRFPRTKKNLLKTKRKSYELIKCKICSLPYKRKRPSDPEYLTPKDKPSGNDYIVMEYLCSSLDVKHKNRVYWEKATSGEEAQFPPIRTYGPVTILETQNPSWISNALEP